MLQAYILLKMAPNEVTFKKRAGRLVSLVNFLRSTSWAPFLNKMGALRYYRCLEAPLIGALVSRAAASFKLRKKISAKSFFASKASQCFKKLFRIQTFSSNFFFKIWRISGTVVRREKKEF